MALDPPVESDVFSVMNKYAAKKRTIAPTKEAGGRDLLKKRGSIMIRAPAVQALANVLTVARVEHAQI